MATRPTIRNSSSPLFAGVGSKRLGLTLDTGNFYWYGHPLSKVYELYEMFASRVFHTHCKSIGYPAEEREKQRPMGWQYVKYHGPIYSGRHRFRPRGGDPEEGRLYERSLHRGRVAGACEERTRTSSPRKFDS